MLGNKSAIRFGRQVGMCMLFACLLALAACGGSMGSDPASSSGASSSKPPPVATSDPPAGPPAAPTASVGNASGSYYSTITGTLAGSNPCNCGTPVYALVSQPAHGTLTITNATTGAFSYVPDPGFTGTDSFTFDFGNGTATSAPATETLTISSNALASYNAPVNIGANVDGPVYYSASSQYVDVVRMAGNGAGQTWYSTSTDTVHGSGVDLAQIGLLDANGWPEEDAGITVICCGAPDGSAVDPGIASNLLGKYQLSFNGIATIGDYYGQIENQQYNSATNTTTATLDQQPLENDGSGMFMSLSFTKTQRSATAPINSGITNLHVIRPQFAPNGMQWWSSPTQEFTNPFLAALAPFSTLRFMDWTATNGNQVADWDERTPPDWPGGHEIETDGVWQWNSTDHKMELTNNVWTGTGQSWESAIDLANATGKDLWINIPVRATDDYVTQLATLLKQRLDPGLHVYIEYSNEVWNGGFEQWDYNDAATTALLAGNETAAGNYQTYCVSYANDVCHEAEREMQISNDFAAVWGTPAIGAAIRPVLCHQLVGAGVLWIALGYINNVYGPPAKYFYGICSAPYWGPDSPTAGESVDDFLAADRASITQWDGYLLNYTAAARFYGLHNFTYEGGPGTNDLGGVDTPNLLAANADPRMGADVTQALTGAFQNGVDMYMYYNASSAWSQYGAWGATDDILDLTQPKWQALQKLAGQSVVRSLAITAGNPSLGVPYPGTSVPGTIDAGLPMFSVIDRVMRPVYQAAGGCTPAANGLPDTCSFFSGNPPGNTEYGYLVTAAQAGTYTVTLKVDSRGNYPASTAQLYVNQQPQGGVITIPVSPRGNPSSPTAVTVSLPAGMSLIELEATSGSFAIDSIVIAAGN